MPSRARTPERKVWPPNGRTFSAVPKRGAEIKLQTSAAALPRQGRTSTSVTGRAACGGLLCSALVQPGGWERHGAANQPAARDETR